MQYTSVLPCAAKKVNNMFLARVAGMCVLSINRISQKDGKRKSDGCLRPFL